MKAQRFNCPSWKESGREKRVRNRLRLPDIFMYKPSQYPKRRRLLENPAFLTLIGWTWLAEVDHA